MAWSKAGGYSARRCARIVCKPSQGRRRDDGWHEGYAARDRMGGWASSASSCWSVGARGGGPRQIPVFQVRALRAIDESLANTVRSNMAIQRALLVVVTSLVLLLSGATLVFAHAQLTSAAPPRVNCSLCASSRARAAANPARALGRAAVELG